jgi:hypothetical protein
MDESHLRKSKETDFTMALRLEIDGSHHPKNRETAVIKWLLPRGKTKQPIARWISIAVKSFPAHLHVQRQDPKANPSHTTLTKKGSTFMMHIMTDIAMTADRDPRP